MNRNSNNRSNLRNKVLTGAIISALAVGTAGAATLSTSQYTIDTAWAQTLTLNNFIQSITNQQDLLAPVSASVTGGSIPIIYFGSGVPITNSNNSVLATAGGNQALAAPSSISTIPDGNNIAMALLDADLNNSGLGVLSGQVDNGSAVTSAILPGATGTVGTLLLGYNDGPNTQSNNTVAASTQVNTASSGINGDLPNNSFVGSTPGNVAVNVTPAGANQATSDSHGDLMVSNAQSSANNVSSATVTNAVIQTLDYTNGIVTADFTSAGNAISAGFGGNSASNAIDATGGGAVSYQGSAVVSNAQQNSGATGSAIIDAGATPSLGLPGSNILTGVSGTGSFDGTVTESGNGIDANAHGNSASNSIAFADGINLAGDVAAATSLDLTNQPATPGNGPKYGNTTATADGDLALLNSQSNRNSGFSSSITGSNIVAIVNNVGTSDSSLTVSGNHAKSGAAGNSAANSVSANSGNSFADGVAVGNQQTNTYTPVSATASTVHIGADLVSSSLTSVGDVTVAGNAVGATAAGNSASTAVNLASGNTFDSGSSGALASVAGSTNRNGVSSNQAGVNVGNTQMGVDGNTSATASSDWLGAYYSDSIVGGSSTVSGNSTAANAFGNDDNTSVSLSAANATATAALVSFQDDYSDTGGAVATATASGDYTGIVVAQGNVGAALDVSGNDISANAYRNRGNHSLSTDFGNATLGDGNGTWSGYSSTISDAHTFGNSGNAALGLYSDQVGGGNVTSTLAGDQVGVQVRNGDVNDSTVAVGNNAVSGSAIGNSVVNTLSPGVGNLSTDGGDAAQIASLGNFQQNENNSQITTTISGGALNPGEIYAVVNGTVTGTPITIEGNSVNGFAGGNMATNTMAVTGTSFAPTAIASGGGLNANGVMTSTIDNSALATTTATANAAYTLQNVQTTSSQNGNYAGGTRSAVITNGSIGTVVVGDVTDSPLTVSGNSIGTDVRDNYATNGLSLAGFSNLDTTAALQNVQNSSAALTSSVTGTGIGAGSLGSLSGSDLTVSGNHLSARSFGNTASDTLTAASSGQLAGDSTAATAYANARGAATNAGAPEVNADYGLLSNQYRDGAITVAITGLSPAPGADTGLIGGGAGGDVNGGSMTVSGNTVLAQAQDNSASNGVGVSGANVTTTAALLNQQTMSGTSNASASVTSDYGFITYVGGSLGNTAATPTTVSGNSMLAQSGLNDANNVVSAGASGSINSTNGTYAGATNDVALAAGFVGAVADFALFNTQASGANSSTASVAPGTSGVYVVGNIGNTDVTTPVTVSGNSFAAAASANHAVNAVRLGGMGSTPLATSNASAALFNNQSNAGGAVMASNTGAQVGVFDKGASATNAALTVSGNTLSSNASGNSAGNSVQNLPVALNTGNLESTQGSTGPLNASTALASNSLLNVQSNGDAISAMISGASIGVNPVGGTAALVTSNATVGNNVASAIASGNSASNSIELANLPTGVGSSALVSNQVNTAAVTASVSDTHIGVTAGATSSSPVTVSGNSISATAVGNSVSNSISVGGN